MAVMTSGTVGKMGEQRNDKILLNAICEIDATEYTRVTMNYNHQTADLFLGVSRFEPFFA